MTTFQEIGRDYAERIRKAAGAGRADVAKSMEGRVAFGVSFRSEMDDIFRDLETWLVPETGQPISTVQKNKILTGTDDALGLEQGTMEEIRKSFSNQINYQAALATLLNSLSLR